MTSVLGDATPVYSLQVWHGLNIALIKSVLALLGGIAFYVLLRRYFALATRDRAPLPARFNAAQLYDGAMLRLDLAASWLVRRLGTQRLQAQMLWLIVALVGVPLVLVQPLPRFDRLVFSAPTRCSR